MTQPAYTTNLTLLDGCNTDTGYKEPTATGWTFFNAESFGETDLFIHGANCISGTVKVGVGATLFDNGSGITLGTNDAVSMWATYSAPNSLADETNGGIRQIIGASQANFDYVVHGGSDTYVYGGWINVCMGNPAQITTTAVGSGTGTTYQLHGWAYNAPTAVPSKGNPYAVDVMRYGRHDLVFEYGDATSGYCTFDESARANDANDISFAADTVNADATLANISPDTNDLYPGAPVSGTGIPASTYIKSITDSTTAEMTANATATNTAEALTSQPYNRWGLFQRISGASYLWKGLITLGTATNAVDFRDANATIQIDNTKNVTAAFNAIEVNNASSRVDWTSVSIAASGTTSPGTFTVVDNADVNLDGCSFSDMGAFAFLANSSILNTIFRGCGVITAAGCDMTGSSISGYEGTADTSPVIWDVVTDPDGLLDSMTITKGTASTHAIEFGTTSPTSITIRDMVFSGYNASNGQNDSTFHVKRTSGTVTINIVGGSGNVSYKAEGTTTVNIVLNPVTTTITVKDITDLSVIQYARVLLYPSNATGPMNYQESVSISGNGTTATVTHTGHGLATDDKVLIEGVTSSDEPNGVKTIIVTDVDTYTYASTTSTITGTITSTSVLFNEETNASGIVTDTRSYTSDQPMTGRVRKTTTTPFYKTSPINEIVDSENGLSITVLMIPDE